MIASNNTFIIAAYAVTWIVFAAYLVRLVRAELTARAALERARGELEAGSRP